jgi:hypothetical protein
LKKPARAEHAPSLGTPHQRTIFRSPDRHLAKSEKQAVTRTREGRKEDPRRVLITSRTGASYTVPPGDHQDRRGPKTATERFLSKESQPRLIDLALNNISTGKTSNTRLSPRARNHKASACTNKDKAKTKERKKTASTSTTLGGRNSNSPKSLETTSTTGKRTRGNKNPSPNGQGEQKLKTKPGGGGVRPPPGRRASPFHLILSVFKFIG